MLQERWLPWKTGLYNWEVISLQECNFQTDGLAYDKRRVRSRKDIKQLIALETTTVSNQVKNLAWRTTFKKILLRF